MGTETYDPATTVGALLHFRFHLLSRCASPGRWASGVARVVTERTMRESICKCDGKIVRDMDRGLKHAQKRIES